MKLQSFRIALTCAGTMLAVAAFAQQTPSSTDPSSSGSSTTGQAGQSGQSSTLGQSSTTQTGQSGQANQMGDLRASKAIGADVKTAQGEKLGKINDLILNPTSGKVDFAVIDWNNKLVPVPFRLLNASQSTGRTSFLSPTGSEVTFTAQVDTTKLQNAPTIDKSRWTDIQQPGWSQRVYSHFGLQSESGSMGAPGSSTSPDQGSGSSIPQSTEPQGSTPSNPQGSTGTGQEQGSSGSDQSQPQTQPQNPSGNTSPDQSGSK